MIKKLYIVTVCMVRDEVDAKKKRASDPMARMNVYVDQSIKVRKMKHGHADQVSTKIIV